MSTPFSVILAAAHATRGTFEARMVALSYQFPDSVPVRFAEALHRLGLATTEQYRAVDERGFDFDNERVPTDADVERLQSEGWQS